ALLRGRQRTKQRPLNQKFFGEKLSRRRLPVDAAGSFLKPDFQKLAGVVPFVDGMVDVEAFVALESNQLAIQTGSQTLGHLRLSDTRFAFQQQGTLKL